VPVEQIPDSDVVLLRHALPEAIRLTRESLEPNDPAEVLSALQIMANRRGLQLPDDLALDLDVELMSEWPQDLWRKAFKAVWSNFSYRRFPEVPDFKTYIAVDLEERRTKLSQLTVIDRKLSVRPAMMAVDRDGKRKRASPQCSP